MQNALSQSVKYLTNQVIHLHISSQSNFDLVE